MTQHGPLTCMHCGNDRGVGWFKRFDTVDEVRRHERMCPNNPNRKARKKRAAVAEAPAQHFGEGVVVAGVCYDIYGWGEDTPNNTFVVNYGRGAQRFKVEVDLNDIARDRGLADVRRLVKADIEKRAAA